MFIHPRSSLESPTRFQTEMGSVYPFSDQNGGKTLLDGAAHSFMAYIREYPPPPGQKHRKFSGSACSRIPLEPCVFGACSGNRSVFILDPPLKWQLFGLAKSHYGCWFSWFRCYWSPWEKFPWEHHVKLWDGTRLIRFTESASSNICYLFSFHLAKWINHADPG